MGAGGSRVLRRRVVLGTLRRFVTFAPFVHHVFFVSPRVDKCRLHVRR